MATTIDILLYPSVDDPTSSGGGGRDAAVLAATLWMLPPLPLDHEKTRVRSNGGRQCGRAAKIGKGGSCPRSFLRASCGRSNIFYQWPVYTKSLRTRAVSRIEAMRLVSQCLHNLNCATGGWRVSLAGPTPTGQRGRAYHLLPPVYAELCATPRCRALLPDADAHLARLQRLRRTMVLVSPARSLV